MLMAKSKKEKTLKINASFDEVMKTLLNSNKPMPKDLYNQIFHTLNEMKCEHCDSDVKTSHMYALIDIDGEVKFGVKDDVVCCHDFKEKLLGAYFSIASQK